MTRRNYRVLYLAAMAEMQNSRVGVWQSKTVYQGGISSIEEKFRAPTPSIQSPAL